MCSCVVTRDELLDLLGEFGQALMGFAAAQQTIIKDSQEKLDLLQSTIEKNKNELAEQIEAVLTQK